MNLYVVQALVPIQEEGQEDSAVLIDHYTEAPSKGAAEAIIQAVHGIPEERIIKVEFMSDRIWRMSDVKKGKGNA